LQKISKPFGYSKFNEKNEILMISVVIRNKNQASALSFVEKFERTYFGDIAEIIVLDNLSTDSKEIAEQYGARFVTIENFSFAEVRMLC
jgi:glycosyltransferase involved in cell wall biosynthesis